jgi:hypothetical protein
MLTLWFLRVQFNDGRVRKLPIVALGRKLLIVFWNYVLPGGMLEGAETTAAWKQTLPLFNLPEPDQLRRIQASRPKFGLA